VSRKPITINPGIHNSRQNISLAIKAKQTWRFSELLGCTVFDFRWHLERQFSPGMSWDNYGAWCVDHTIWPCSFPLDDPGAKYRCHHWSNLGAAWLTDCQERKGDEHLAQIPDYDTLKFFTPRATIITEHGIPVLASGINLDRLDRLDRLVSRIESANYAKSYRVSPKRQLLDKK